MYFNGLPFSFLVLSYLFTVIKFFVNTQLGAFRNLFCVIVMTPVVGGVSKETTVLMSYFFIIELSK